MIAFKDLNTSLIYQYKSSSIYKYPHLLENCLRFSTKTHCQLNQPAMSSYPDGKLTIFN